MNKLTFSYIDFITTYMSKDNPPPLTERSIITLENKQDIIDTAYFSERDLRYVMIEYKLGKMIV